MREELRRHCYRMLGSVHDAEDAVQETLVRAWRGRVRFEGRASVRAWLYRIATNVCLAALASRPSRLLPTDLGAAAGPPPLGPAGSELPWLQPYPTWDPVDGNPLPDARLERKEEVRLAWVAALQRLTPRGRAALLLCDVVGMTAAEAATVLETSVPAVNSLLQRARQALSSAPLSESVPPPPELLGRYVRAWEAMDVDGLTNLLREDAVFQMPPRREWYAGREAIRAFFAWAWTEGNYGGFRLEPIAANGAPALAVYSRRPEEGGWGPHSIHVADVRDGGISELVLFQDARLFPAFVKPDG